MFATGDIGIWWWDAERRQGHASYVFEHGVRFHHEPYQLKPGEVWERLFDGRETLHVNNRAESIAMGMHALEGTDQSISALCMPIVGGDRVLGSVVIEDYERENAFGPDAVRLLSTVVAAMGTALENARLFDETQRLLKETEARNAELAVINSVQQGIAAQLEFQGVIDLVGDQLHEVFKDVGAGVQISLLDEAQGLVRYVYVRGADGQRWPGTTIPLRHEHPAQQAINRRETVHARNAQERRDRGLFNADGTAASEPGSELAVGVFGSRGRLGAITLEAGRDHAFTDSLVRLLETIAASMGVALENARLFEETQRREREANALSEVGRDLSSTLDLATVMDRIAAHARELLAAQSSAIFLPDADGRRYRAIVALGDTADELKAAAVEPGHGIIGSLLQSGQPEFVNDTAADRRALQLAGTEGRAEERLMVVPLKSGDQVQGAMAVWRTGGKLFEARELVFLSGLSQQAVIALNNARLFDETQAGTGAADRHGRSPAGDRQLDGRPEAGVREDRRVLRAAVRRADLRGGDRRGRRATVDGSDPHDGERARGDRRGQGGRHRGKDPGGVSPPAGRHPHREGDPQGRPGRGPRPPERSRPHAACGTRGGGDRPRHLGGRRAAPVAGSRHRVADDVPQGFARPAETRRTRSSSRSPTRP